jgi:hypothetical protein
MASMGRVSARDHVRRRLPPDMTTRRYEDDEVREIFSLATRGETRDRTLPVDSGGLTLEDLQLIGQETGIEPARIADAAASLDSRGKPAPIRRSFGLPVGMSRVVALPRRPSDREWERLIAEFRSTFGAQGVATSTGGLRQWSQGNLHISVEPTEHGEQLRLSTLRDDAIALNGLGVVMGGMATLTSAIVTAAGKPEKALLVFGMFGGMSLAAFLTNVIRQPRWARERESQMEALAEHAVKLLSKPEVDRSPERESRVP